MASNRLHGALSAVGILAWSVFILGCAIGSVAWSPNGSKVAFAYHDPIAKEDGVMIYDRVSNSLTPAYVANGSNGSEDDGPLIQAQWDQTKPRLLVMSYQKDKNQVERFDLLALSTKSQMVRHFTLALESDLPILPVPQKGSRLFLSNKQQLLTLDLDTGEMQRDDQFGELSLYPAGDRILYRRNSMDSTAGKKNVIGSEFGVFDPDIPALYPIFTVLDKDLEEQGIGNIIDVAVRDTGYGLAATVQRSQGQDVIVLFNEHGIERVLTPQLPVQQPFKLGSLAWHRNGNIYAAAAIRVSDDIAQYAVAEIQPEGGAVRLIPIVRANWNTEESDFVNRFCLTERMAVSPDGRTLATTTAALDDKEITADNRGLFLIDLADRERKVTRIPISAINSRARH